MNELYMQFSNCIAIKGFNRSILYDVQRVRYLLVDNEFAEMLITNKNKILLTAATNNYKYFINQLVEDEWGIFTNKSIASNFPELNLQWNHYAEITNAQLEIIKIENEYFDNFFEKILPQIESLNCKTLQINFLKIIEYKELHEFLVRFSDTDIHEIIIHLPYIPVGNDKSEELFLMQPRLNLLCYYNCPDQVEHFNEKSYYSTKDIGSRNNHEISTDYFTTNIKLFTESQNHNTYYNRKLCIDADGNIKNTPEQVEYFGNVKDIPLKNIIKQEKFQRLWYIHKGIIDVCKDCEFRHMCVDSCNLIKRKDSTWYRSQECNYNPYISKWNNEEGYKKLSECGIKVTEHEFKIENFKLNKINNKLWED